MCFCKDYRLGNRRRRMSFCSRNYFSCVRQARSAISTLKQSKTHPVSYTVHLSLQGTPFLTTGRSAWRPWTTRACHEDRKRSTEQLSQSFGMTLVGIMPKTHRAVRHDRRARQCTNEYCAGLDRRGGLVRRCWSRLKRSLPTG